MSSIYRIAYAVRDASDRDGKSHWNRVGVTFINKDGSETVVLDAIPINGRLVLQEFKENPSTDK